MRKKSCSSTWKKTWDQVYYISLGCMIWPVFSYCSHLAPGLILEGNCSTDWHSNEGGWTSAADRLQCSGDRLIWCWATAKSQQRVSGAPFFWSLKAVWHFSSSPVSLMSSVRLQLDYKALILYSCFQKSENPYNKPAKCFGIWKNTTHTHTHPPPPIFYNHKNSCNTFFWFFFLIYGFQNLVLHL